MRTPAGLCDNNFEWFLLDSEVWSVYHQRARTFRNTSSNIKQLFIQEMQNDQAFMQQVNFRADYETLQMYIRNNYAALNEVPDLESSTGRTNREPSLESFGLTSRELDVIKQLANGDPDKWGCEHLGIRRDTYRQHIKHISSKLGVHSKTAITKFAFENQIL